MDDRLPLCLEKLLVQHKTLEGELGNIQGFVNNYRPMRDNYHVYCDLIDESGEDRHQYDEAFSERTIVFGNIQALAISYKVTQKELGPKIPENFSPKEKVPKKAESFKFGEIESRKPAWCFHRIDAEANDFGFNPDGKQFDKMIGRLKSFETRTWKEIFYERRDDSNHFTQIDNLTKSAQARLKKLNLDDQDQLIQLRIDKSTRLWGFFTNKNPQLYLLWHDPSHKVFNSKA